MKMIYDYYLVPKNGRKSFYGKAIVKENTKTGERALYSYGTPIIKIKGDKKMRLYSSNNVSMTTCSHIISFCELHKKDFVKLHYHKWED